MTDEVPRSLADLPRVLWIPTQRIEGVNCVSRHDDGSIRAFETLRELLAWCNRTEFESSLTSYVRWDGVGEP